MPNSDTKSSSQRSSETENFFAKLEQRIVKQLREEASSDAGRDELMRSTGIHDPELLRELGQLGVTADGLIALRLFPLVLVAWAERDVDANERAAVMKESLRLGVREDTTAWILLDQWLTQRPPGIGVEAWKRYTQETFSQISEVARHRLIELTEKQMTGVAKASGGHLGFGKVSSREKAIIHQVVTSMRQQR